MEENEREILPNEVWCHILTFVNDFDDIMALKITNRFSYQELRTRDPLSTIDKAIKISEDMRDWFANRCERPNLTPYLYYLPAKRTATFRVVFIGPSCSGKTTFLTRWVKGVYKDDIEPTTTVTLLPKEFAREADGLTCRMEIVSAPEININDPNFNYIVGCIWFFMYHTALDLSRVKSVTSDLSLINVAQGAPITDVFITAGEAIFVTFSLDNRGSFVTSINYWLTELYQSFRGHRSNEHPFVYLLGLKSDLERKVSTGEAKALARVLKIKYFECSAKLNENVNEVMEEMKNDLLKTVKAPSTKSQVPANDRRCSLQ